MQRKVKFQEIATQYRIFLIKLNMPHHKHTFVFFGLTFVSLVLTMFVQRKVKFPEIATQYCIVLVMFACSPIISCQTESVISVVQGQNIDHISMIDRCLMIPLRISSAAIPRIAVVSNHLLV